jgi:hypothetical protein
MKQFIKLLDTILLYLIPAGYVYLIVSLQSASTLLVGALFLIYSVFIIFFCWRYVKLSYLQMEWESMRYYYIASKIDLSGKDREYIMSINIDYTFSNVFIKKADLSKYIDDKLLLFDIQEVDKRRHII